jgi:transcriptional regulator with XRE-family HTH domain
MYHYGITIRAFREKRKMTQQQLADRWPRSERFGGGEGVNPSYVQDIEHGRKRIDDSQTLRTVCDLLHIPYWQVGLSEYDPFSQILQRKLKNVFGVENIEALLQMIHVDHVEGESSSEEPRARAPVGEDEAMTPTPETEVDAASSPAQTSRLWLPHAPTLQDFLASNITCQIFQIAHTDYSTSDEMINAVQAALKEFDMMNTGDSTYKITRREAMCELASIPMIALGQKQTLQTKRYEEMLRYCTTALEACWELYRGSDPTGTRHAFDCVCTYVPLLETIAKDSAQYRREALDLAAQYALLQTMLGWQCSDRVQRVHYAQNALSLCKATGNILFQLSAYPKLGYTYITGRSYTMAWATMQEGEHVLKEYQHKKNQDSLPSGLIGNFYSTYSQAQTHNGISPDTALGIATDSEPLKGRVAFIEFTASDQWWEAAWTCDSKGDPTQAMVWLKKLIDLETLAPCPNVPQSEWERIGAVNIMTHSLLQSKKRDMYQITHIWKMGMMGAKALKHEGRYEEAITNFEIMRAFWPSERNIVELLPLTAHWSEEG